MASLAEFRTTRLGNGDVTSAFRSRVEGVWIESPQWFDTDAADDTLTPVSGDANPFVVGDQLWMQDAPGFERPGGLDQRTWWVVERTGETMKLSTTEGGAVRDITTSSKTIMNRLLADYRQVSGEDILLSVKTNIVGELTESEKRELVEMIEGWLMQKKAEHDGVTT